MGRIVSLLEWIMNQLGFAICHQLPEKSLHFGGRQLPVCSRDTGLFLGFAVCFLALLIIYRREGDRFPPWQVMAVLALFLVPTAIDAITSYAGWRETTNLVRLATGALAGTGIAALVFPLVVSQLTGREGQRIPQRWWNVLLLLLVPGGICLALLPRRPWAFWVWAPLVSLSILFTLLVLNFTLISLVASTAGEGRAPRVLSIGALAAAAALVEMAVSNRLHWMVERLL
ncbi:MAG: DUF2085 domain-containing protein [Actinobacteria bacterium]|nr:DUF2085 domain-containing protein [Actinomycetota bacterium]